jgi:hypothetical protein
MAKKKTARRKTRTRRAGSRTARSARKTRRAAPKRAAARRPARKAAARVAKPAAPIKLPGDGPTTLGGLGTPGPLMPPGEPVRRETPWGGRPSSEAEEEFGREDDEEPM